MTLVRVAKDGAVLLVHPTTVASHEQAGWAVSPDQSNTEEAPDEPALRQDGPTVAEFVAAGYPAKNYPPDGYAPRSTPEEIAAAIADDDAKAKAKAGSGDDGSKTPVAIPADWESLHHNAKIKLAETILGGDLVPEGAETKTEAAIRVITAEVSKRAA